MPRFADTVVSESMSRIVTLRLKDDTYERFKTLAERENRPLSNFIETAALRFIEGDEFVDPFEMDEIRSNVDLNESLKRGTADAEAGRGRFV